MTSVRYSKVYPAPYDGRNGEYYNKKCPVELFQATTGPGKKNKASIIYSKVFPAPYDGPVGAHYNKKCPVELFRATTVPGHIIPTYTRKQDIGKGEDIRCAMSQESNTDLKVNNFVSEPAETKTDITKDIKKSTIIRRLGKSFRGLKKRLAGKAEINFKKFETLNR